MIARLLYNHIAESLTKFPVVGLVGPRQAGKTTLARQLAAVNPAGVDYLDLELPSDLNRLGEAEWYLREQSDRLVIIDEVQRMPELFPLIRALVDRHRRPGRFLLLGSASPDLVRQAAESLAGRIVYHELFPLNLAETREQEWARLWVRGGFPESFLAATDRDSLAWRQAFIATYLERDLPQLGVGVPAAQLRRFWTMLAHLHAQLWNASQLAGSMGLSPPTMRRYLGILQDTFIVRQLLPYHINIGKRLVKAPRVYLRDSGLLHALLGLADREALLSSPWLGASWEGFVIEQLHAGLPVGWQTFFFRTAAGAEIDLLLQMPSGSLLAVEIKSSLSPRPQKGFWHGMADLGCRRGYVVYPGEARYPLGPGVEALPIRMLSSIIEENPSP